MKIKFKGQELKSEIKLPPIENQAPDFLLVKSNLEEVSLADYQSQYLVLNIFPSIDTGTCANSVKKFNQALENLQNVAVLCISMDLPFAHKRFCEHEQTHQIETLSAFRSSFGPDYGVLLSDSPLKGLFARSLVLIDQKRKVVYTQVVEEITKEPNYEAILAEIR